MFYRILYAFNIVHLINESKGSKQTSILSVRTTFVSEPDSLDPESDSEPDSSDSSLSESEMEGKRNFIYT